MIWPYQAVLKSSKVPLITVLTLALDCRPKVNFNRLERVIKRIPLGMDAIDEARKKGKHIISISNSITHFHMY